MNRHGYHNEYEYEEDVEEGNVEMPLPTYEEVVGASNHNIGFKADLLVPGSSDPRGRAGSSGGLPRQCTSVPNGEDVRAPNSRRKTCAKSYIVGITGIVLIPLLILLIVLQLKTCSSCEQVVNKDRTIVQLNMEELQNCNANLLEKERQYTGIFSELKSVKKQRDELLIKQETADVELKDLRYQYNTAFSDATIMRAEVSRLNEEIEKYKALVKNAQNNWKKQKDT